MPEFLSGISAAVNKIGTEVTRKGLELVLKVTGKVEYRVENPQNLQEALRSGRGIIVVANHTVPDYARPETIVGKLTKSESDHELAEQTGGAFLPTDALLLRRLILEMSEQNGKRIEPHIMARVNHSTGFGGETNPQELAGKTGSFTRLQDILNVIPTAPFAGRDKIAFWLNKYAEEETEKVLRDGGVVIVFPQGDGFLPETDLNDTPISSRFGKWAAATDSVIVPITTEDTNRTYGLVTGKTQAKFTIGDVIDPSAPDAGRSKEIAQKAWEEVVKGRQKTQATTT